MTEKSPSLPDDPFGTLMPAFRDLLVAFNEVAAHMLADAGRSEEADLVRGVTDALRRQADGLAAMIADGLAAADDASLRFAARTLEASGAAELVANGLQSTRVAARGGPLALVGLLQFIEPVKKVLRLILGKLLPESVTKWINIVLDSIDNLLGNSAEAVAPEAGTRARRVRSSMYRQLTEVFAADAAQARAAAVLPREPEDEE
jgi:hypothetical protein